jgi:hypothetical protein
VTGWVGAIALLATPLAFYSLAFWEQTVALVVVVGGLSLVLGHSGIDARWQRWALFGALLGLGAWVRTEVGFLFPVLAIPMLPRGEGRGVRTTAMAIASFVFGGLTGSLVQRLTLGTWLPVHVTYHTDSSFYSPSYLQSRLDSILSFLAPHWSCGVAVVLWLTALTVVLTRRGSRHGGGLVIAVAAAGAAMAAASVVPAMRWALGARPTDAFPFAAPAATWLVLSALPVVLWRQDRNAIFESRRLVLFAVAAWLPVAVFAARAIRSFEWGGRLFLPTVVLLTGVMVSFGLPGGPFRRFRTLLVGVVVASAIAIQGLGLVLLHHGTTTHHGLAAEVDRFTDSNEPVITDAYLLPLVSGRTFFDTRFLYCTGQGAVPLLASVFADESVEYWSYGTVLRAPGERLVMEETIVGTDGSRWLLVDQLHRRVGSREVRFHRYRRSEFSAPNPKNATPGNS